MKDFRPAPIKPTISFRRSFVKEIWSADILSASAGSPLNAFLEEGSRRAQADRMSALRNQFAYIR